MTASAPPAAVLRLLYADGAPCGAEYSGGRLLWGAPYPPPWTVARRDIAWRLWPPGFLAPVRGPLAPQAVPPDDWAAARYGLDAVDAPITGLAALLAARDADALRSVVNRTPLGALRVPEFRAAAAADGMPLHEDLVAALETRELVASALRWTRRTEVAEVLFPAAAHPAEAPRVWVFLTPPPCGGGRALVADARAVDAAVRLSELSPVFLRYNTDSDLWGGALHTLWDALSWAATVVITRRLPPALVSAELAARGIVPGRVVRAFPAPPPGGLLVRACARTTRSGTMPRARARAAPPLPLHPGRGAPGPARTAPAAAARRRRLAAARRGGVDQPLCRRRQRQQPAAAARCVGGRLRRGARARDARRRHAVAPRRVPVAGAAAERRAARGAAAAPAVAASSRHAIPVQLRAGRGDGPRGRHGCVARSAAGRRRRAAAAPAVAEPRVAAAAAAWSPHTHLGRRVRAGAQQRPGGARRGRRRRGISHPRGAARVAAAAAASRVGTGTSAARARARARARTHGGSRATQRHGVIRRSPALAASDPVPDWRGVYGCVTPPTAVVAAPGSSSSSSGSGGWWHGKRCFKPDERWEGPPVPYLVFMCSERLAPVDMLAWAGVARDAVFVLADYAPRAFDGAVPVPTHLYRLLSAAAASVD